MFPSSQKACGSGRAQPQFIALVFTFSLTVSLVCRSEWSGVPDLGAPPLHMNAFFGHPPAIRKPPRHNRVYPFGSVFWHQEIRPWCFELAFFRQIKIRTHRTIILLCQEDFTEVIQMGSFFN